MSTPDLTVNTAALARAATDLDTVAERLRRLGPGALDQPGDVGHPGLAAALQRFGGRWEWGVGDGLRAVEELAEGLHAAGVAYGQADGAPDGLLARLLADLVGNPTAAGGPWSGLPAAVAPDRELPDWDRLGAEWAAAGREFVENSGLGMAARAASGQNPIADHVEDLRPIAD